MVCITYKSRWMGYSSHRTLLFRLNCDFKKQFCLFLWNHISSSKSLSLHPIFMASHICKYGKYKSSGDEIGYFICRTVPRGVCSAKAFKVAALNKQAEDIYLLQNRHRIEIHFGYHSFWKQWKWHESVWAFSRWLQRTNKQTGSRYLSSHK